MEDYWHITLNVFKKAISKFKNALGSKNKYELERLFPVPSTIFNAEWFYTNVIVDDERGLLHGVKVSYPVIDDEYVPATNNYAKSGYKEIYDVDYYSNPDLVYDIIQYSAGVPLLYKDYLHDTHYEQSLHWFIKLRQLLSGKVSGTVVNTIITSDHKTELENVIHSAETDFNYKWGYDEYPESLTLDNISLSCQVYRMLHDSLYISIYMKFGLPMLMRAFEQYYSFIFHKKIEGPVYLNQFDSAMHEATEYMERIVNLASAQCVETLYDKLLHAYDKIAEHPRYTIDGNYYSFMMLHMAERNKNDKELPQKIKVAKTKAHKSPITEQSKVLNSKQPQRKQIRISKQVNQQHADNVPTQQSIKKNNLPQYNLRNGQIIFNLEKINHTPYIRPTTPIQSSPRKIHSPTILTVVPNTDKESDKNNDLNESNECEQILIAKQDSSTNNESQLRTELDETKQLLANVIAERNYNRNRICELLDIIENMQSQIASLLNA